MHEVSENWNIGTEDDMALSKLLTTVLCGSIFKEKECFWKDMKAQQQKTGCC